MHCAVLSKPVFHRAGQIAFRQVGRILMDMQEVEDPSSLLKITIAWMRGQNLDHSFSLPDSTSEYMFQLANNPGTQAVSCISPPAGVDTTVFPKHRFYLPCWIDEYFQLLDNESDVIKTFLAIPMIAVSSS